LPSAISAKTIETGVNQAASDLQCRLRNSNSNEIFPVPSNPIIILTTPTKLRRITRELKQGNHQKHSATKKPMAEVQPPYHARTGKGYHIPHRKSLRFINCTAHSSHQPPPLGTGTLPLAGLSLHRHWRCAPSGAAAPRAVASHRSGRPRLPPPATGRGAAPRSRPRRRLRA